MFDEISQDSVEKEYANPSLAQTEKSPQSEHSLNKAETLTDEGTVKKSSKVSVRKKLNRYKAEIDKQKNSERVSLELDVKNKAPSVDHQSTQAPKVKMTKKTKER